VTVVPVVPDEPPRRASQGAARAVNGVLGAGSLLDVTELSGLGSGWPGATGGRTACAGVVADFVDGAWGGRALRAPWSTAGAGELLASRERAPRTEGATRDSEAPPGADEPGPRTPLPGSEGFVADPWGAFQNAPPPEAPRPLLLPDVPAGLRRSGPAGPVL
jgi:hypothetical protein